jgi:hypothetical protein
VVLSVFSGAASFVELPVRPPRPDDSELVAFEEPETAPPLEVELLRPTASSRQLQHELTTDVFEEILLSDDGHWRQVANQLEYDSVTTTRYRITEGDPLSAWTRCERTFKIGRGDWRTRVEAASTLRSDATTFYLDSELEAFEGDQRVFARTWTFQVARKLV